LSQISYSIIEEVCDFHFTIESTFISRIIKPIRRVWIWSSNSHNSLQWRCFLRTHFSLQC